MADTVGARLRQERQKLGISQTDFAKLAGVSRNSQVEYEGDKTAPNTDYLVRLEAHGVQIAYVLTGRRIADSLSSDESELLDAYRGTHPLCKGAILLLARHANDEDTSDNVRHILREALAR